MIKHFPGKIIKILIYQLKLTEYNKAQQKNIWLDERHTSLNKDLTIGVLGVGYLGKFIANKLKSLNYNAVSYTHLTLPTNREV